MVSITWENPFLFRIEGTTAIPCERTVRSHVHFDTNFEDSCVRDSTVTSRMIRRAGFCEVLDANRERQNWISVNKVLLRDSHFLSKAQI